MTRLKRLLIPAALLAASAAVHAQDWQEDGRARGFERAARVFWDGPCRVVQRVDSDGELVERRRCRGDREAEMRASRLEQEDDIPPRPYVDRRRHSDPDGFREADEAAQAARRHDDDDRRPAPAVYAEAAPPAAPRPARIIAQGVPVAAPAPAPKRPVQPAPRPVPRAQAAPAPLAAKAPPFKAAARVAVQAAPRKSAVPASAPKLAVKPMTKAPSAARVTARIMPARSLRASQMAPVARTAPAPAARQATRPPVRLAAKVPTAPKRQALPSSAPAIKPVRTVVPIEPKAAPRIAARAETPTPRPVARVQAKPAPGLVPKPGSAPARLIAKAPGTTVAAPVRVTAKAAPAAAAQAARVVVKATPAPAARPGQRSDWLVLLPPEKAATAPQVRPVPEPENSAPLVQARVYAKGESYLQSQAYREYVMRKRSDPYSNLK